jgi:hypothetical protein
VRAPLLEEGPRDDVADRAGGQSARDHRRRHLAAQRHRHPGGDRRDQWRVHARAEGRRQGERGHHAESGELEREHEGRQRERDEGRDAEPQGVDATDELHGSDAPEHSAGAECREEGARDAGATAILVEREHRRRRDEDHAQTVGRHRRDPEHPQQPIVNEEADAREHTAAVIACCAGVRCGTNTASTVKETRNDAASTESTVVARRSR